MKIYIEMTTNGRNTQKVLDTDKLSESITAVCYEVQRYFKSIDKVLFTDRSKQHDRQR